jgi:hypothetical protein
MEHYTLHIVTGAPGAGKSTTLAAFLELKSAFLAFDIDWLGVAASDLAGKDIFFDPSTWKPYGAVWFEVLHMIRRNGKVPVFFAPTSPDDIMSHGKPAWCSNIAWLLLDCDDAIRRGRLKQRPEWTATMIDEAVDDARLLRQTAPSRIDTGLFSPQLVAGMVLQWLEQASERSAG